MLGSSNTCVHGGQAYAFFGQAFEGLGSAQVVNSDVLDAWYPPVPSIEKLWERFGVWSLHNSPPTRGDGLRSSIAKARGISPSHLLLGHGSSDLIFRVLPALFSHKSRIVLPCPQYGEYYFVLSELHGHDVLEIESPAEEDFKISPQRLVDAVRIHGADAVVIVNPSNPTGNFLSRTDLRWILEQIPVSTWLVIDETYIDYCPGESLEDLVGEWENLVILKSMSKIYALSGARVGYAVVPHAVRERLERWTPPYVVSTFGQMAAIEALQHPEYYSRRISETKERHRYLQDEIGEICGCRALGSVGNFVLVDLKETQTPASLVARRLFEAGICVRELHSFRVPESERLLRLTVLDYPQMNILLQALREAMFNP